MNKQVMALYGYALSVIPVISHHLEKGFGAESDNHNCLLWERSVLSILCWLGLFPSLCDSVTHNSSLYEVARLFLLSCDDGQNPHSEKGAMCLIARRIDDRSGFSVRRTPIRGMSATVIASQVRRYMPGKALLCRCMALPLASW